MTAEELLKIHPLNAVKLMAAERYGSPATPDWFIVKRIYSSNTDPTAMVELEFNELFVPIAHRWKRNQSMTVSVNKMDLSLLSKGPALSLTINTLFDDKSCKELIGERYAHTGIVLTDNDIEPVEAVPSITAVPASNKSIRWWGMLPVVIKTAVNEIGKYIKRPDVVLDYSSTFTQATLLSGIVNALNKTNSTQLPIEIPLESVTILNGTLQEAGNEADKFNTSVDIRFTHPYDGDLTVRYGRRSFHQTFGNPIPVKGFGTLTMVEVLEAINAFQQTAISLDELEPYTIPTEVVRGEVQLKEGKERIVIKGSSTAHVGEIWVEFIKDYIP